jgi:hypothetical protein
LLLESLERVQCALGRIAICTCFHQLRIQIQDFFLIAAPLHAVDLGLGSLELSLRARSLGARVGVIEHNQ